MAPSKRTSNGRSPLVNQQSQITAFFTKKPQSSSSSPSPSPYPVLHKQNPNSSSNTNSRRNPSPSLSPITPSPLPSKRRKPLLVVGADFLSPSPEKYDSVQKLYGPEVVDRRIRVYWPLDKSWYEGCVKSFDMLSGKHLVQYDDAEEEMLNFLKAKTEWINVEPVKKLRRLRRIPVVEDEEENDIENLEDDSEDENWGNNVEKEVMEEDCLDDMDLEELEEESGKGGVSNNVDSRKRKVSGGYNLGSNSSKKSKFVGGLKSSTQMVSPGVNGEKLVEPTIKCSADSK